jgi:hypothetical protein
VNHKSGSTEFEEIICGQLPFDHWNKWHQECFQFGVGDIARRYQQKFRGSTVQHVRINKVRILCDNHALFRSAHLDNPLVRCPISFWQVQGMDSLRACCCKPAGRMPRQLSINQEFHDNVG